MDVKPAKKRKFNKPRRVSGVAQNLPPLDMALPGADVGNHDGNLIVKKSFWQKARRLAIRFALIALVSVVIVGGYLFSQGVIKLHKAFKGTTTTAAALKPKVEPINLKTEGDGRINILLMGRGGGTHSAPDLTDTLILASIDPVNYTTVLVSIPRDLWVKLPYGGSGKINSAWEAGEFHYLGRVAPGSTNQSAIEAGNKSIDQVVKEVLGVNIDYNVLIDFAAFRDAVNTVGGITVNVPEDLIDPTMAWENNRNPVLAKAGLQTFDGKHALIYVRSRETSSDFARGLRQRIVIMALKSKIETRGTFSNPIKIAALMNAFGNNVNTDISLGDATRLYDIGRKISNANITSQGFTDPPNSLVTTGPVNGVSAVLPRAGLYNYIAIQNFIKIQLKDGYLVKENAKIQIVNGTSSAKAGISLANLLKSYGYNVIGTSTTASTNRTKTLLVDLSKGKDKFTKHYLEQRLQLSAVTTMPDATTLTNNADFVIIVGNDETITQ